MSDKEIQKAPDPNDVTSTGLNTARVMGEGQQPPPKDPDALCDTSNLMAEGDPEAAGAACASKMMEPTVTALAKGAAHEVKEHPVRAIGEVVAGTAAGLVLPEVIAATGVVGAATAATVAVGGAAYTAYRDISKLTNAKTDAEQEKVIEGIGVDLTESLFGGVGATSGVKLTRELTAATKDFMPAAAAKIEDALGFGQPKIAAQAAGGTTEEVLPSTTITSTPSQAVAKPQDTIMLAQGNRTPGEGGASTPVTPEEISSAVKQGQSFKGADLSGKDLSGTDLSTGDFELADLSYSKLYYSNLSDANMFGTDLSGIKAEGINLSRANLDKANIEGADFFPDADLHEATFREAYISNTEFMASDFHGADFRAADIDNSDFYTSNMRDVDLRGANIDLDTTYFIHADISGVKGDPALLHTLISKGAYSDLQLPDFLPHDLATQLGDLPGKPRVAAIFSWEDTIAKHPMWQDKYATDEQFRIELQKDFQRRFTELSSNDNALSQRTDNLLMAITARENSYGVSPYGKALYTHLVHDLGRLDEASSASSSEEKAIMATLNHTLSDRGIPTVQQLNLGVFKTIVDKIDPAFKDNPDSRLAGEAVNGALRLALTFGREWRSYLKVKGVDVDTPGPLSPQSQQVIHDSSYWLPVAPPQELQGFGAYIRRNIDADPSELEIISKQWSELSDGYKRLLIEALVERLNEDTLSSYTRVRSNEFAAESARWNIPEGDYHQNEERFLASLDTPSPFPLDKSWTVGNLTGRFLPRSDPRGVYLGHYANCCQHPDNAGASAAWYGQEKPNSGFFVVEDKQGQIVAESWAWISDNKGLSFESIESKGLKNRADTVAQVYSNAANDLSKTFHTVTLGVNATGGKPELHATTVIEDGLIMQTGRWPDAEKRTLRLPTEYWLMDGYQDHVKQVLLAHNPDLLPKN